MKPALYLCSAEARSGKSALAVGLLTELCARGGRVGVFRPIVAETADDPLLDLLVPLSTSSLDASASTAVTYDDIHSDLDAAIDRIVERYHAFAAEHDTVLVVGSDFTDVASPTEFSVNATIAAHLGAPLVLVVPGVDRTPEAVLEAAEAAAGEARARHATLAAVIANRVDHGQQDAVAEHLADSFGQVSVVALGADEVLAAPTLAEVMSAVDGDLWLGSEDLLDREVLNILVAGMTMPNVLDHLDEAAVLICPGDREDVLLASLLAHRSSTFPSLAGVILNGGLRPSAQVVRLIDGLDIELPVISAPYGTMRTAIRAQEATGRISADAERKIERARTLVHGRIDVDALVPDNTGGSSPAVVTPLMFEHQLTASARSATAHVVLPEGGEDRILRAADTVLRRGVAELTLLGDPDVITSRASTLGLDLDAARIVDPSNDERLEAFASTYADLRAHKGITVERAAEIVAEPSYFGTLMVHAGQVDGMVSGSVTTTAQTIRPALEVIRTRRGVSVVSSVFFMCLPDRVLVYGDCAINPDPNAEQLADIAISSAATARQFGIEPRVAMLSYSTGSSGSGSAVDKVREATALVRERDGDLQVEGPIQYDAAIDPEVAATKATDQTVAGRATVLIFPDLNTGNNTYKAVQRSAAAVAVGPVLQGLNAPVNDLSRGATVRDIVNTIAITATQARG